MKVAIVGCGAMGSVYAGLLASAGHEVWAVDPWEEHMAAIRERGLRVAGASGDRTVALAGAVATPAEVGRSVDVVILATKVPQAADAAAALGPLLGPDTPVISIQNGLGGPQRVASVLGPERVVIGVVGGFGASVPAPGYAHHNGMEFVRLGEYTGDGVSDRVRELGQLWESGGFQVLLFDDVHQLVWEKLICNCAFSGPSAVMGLTVGEILADEAAWSVASACAAEAWAVARASGVPGRLRRPRGLRAGLRLQDPRRPARRCCSTTSPGAARRSTPSTAPSPRLRPRSASPRRSTPRSPPWSRSRNAPSDRPAPAASPRDRLARVPVRPGRPGRSRP